jgi:hypothetical protein
MDEPPGGIGFRPQVSGFSNLEFMPVACNLDPPEALFPRNALVGLPHLTRETRKDPEEI